MKSMRASSSSKARRRPTAVEALVLVAVLLLAGCQGISTPGERKAQANFGNVREAYQPHVEAAYFDWAASVRRITVERSLPDPRLTFESDIADTVMSVKPGLMMDF